MLYFIAFTMMEVRILLGLPFGITEAAMLLDPTV